MDTPSCDCLTSLSLVDQSCTKFQDLDGKTRSAWNNCIDPGVGGSFADCRRQERLVARYGYQCKETAGVMTSRVSFLTDIYQNNTPLPRLLVADRGCLAIYRATQAGGAGLKIFIRQIINIGKSTRK